MSVASEIELAEWDGVLIPERVRNRGSVTLSLNAALRDYKPLRPGVYLRISHDRFGNEKGVTRQLEDANWKRTDLGWGPFAKIYKENDTGAYKKRKVTRPDGSVEWVVIRPEFRQMLKDLLDGVIDGIIFYDQGRPTAAARVPCRARARAACGLAAGLRGAARHGPRANATRRQAPRPNPPPPTHQSLSPLPLVCNYRQPPCPFLLRTPGRHFVYAGYEFPPTRLTSAVTSDHLPHGNAHRPATFVLLLVPVEISPLETRHVLLPPALLATSYDRQAPGHVRTPPIPSASG